MKSLPPFYDLILHGKIDLSPPPLLDPGSGAGMKKCSDPNSDPGYGINIADPQNYLYLIVIPVDFYSVADPDYFGPNLEPTSGKFGYGSCFIFQGADPTGSRSGSATLDVYPGSQIRIRAFFVIRILDPGT
jgi:hypothetical protein